MPEMRPVILQRFIKNRGLASDVIAEDTDSLFSHAEFGTPEGTWIGAHIDGGVQERAADYCDPVRDYRYEIPLPSELALEQWLTLIRADIGLDYNVTGILGLATHIRALNNPHAVDCSEWCAEKLIEFLGAPKVLNVLPERAYLITPEDLHLSPLFVGRMVYRRG